MNIKDIEARREARAAKEREARSEQKLRDLIALDELEEKHGASNLRTFALDGPATLPGMAILRRPDPAEYRNWLAACRKGSKADAAEATQRLGLDVLLYPDAETWERVLEVLPGASDTLGVIALKATGGVPEQKND